ncbi:aryl-alcohol oxidase [Coprinopsis cinerea AmutBmut pab1-1]|nr:aryl-alcohol oxidase [Coprinopsis cinerea AmutBmut pab1-1]
MSYTRGAKDDYDLWGRVTKDERWGWDALWPYMLRNEQWTPPLGGRDPTGQFDPQYHNTESGKTVVSLPQDEETEYDRRALRKIELDSHQHRDFRFNLDVNSGSPAGLSWNQDSVGNGERSSAATAYLSREVRERANLRILVDTSATRVLPTTEGSELDIRTVEVTIRGGPGNPSSDISNSNATRTMTAKKELMILSAGAFNTPHILMNSGIGDENELRVVGVTPIHHLPAVGKGMSDHPSVRLRWGTTFTPQPLDEAAALLQWQTNRTGPLAKPTDHLYLYYRLPNDSVVFEGYDDPSPGPTAVHFELPLWAMPMEESGPVLPGDLILLTPYSRGSVKLRSSNPFDPPLIDVGYFTHPFDFDAMREGIRIAKQFYEGEAWEGFIMHFIGPDPDTLSEEDFEQSVKENTETLSHPIGTTSMSAVDDPLDKGVVDPELRVKGVKGLRIVDAGVIPYVTSGHTQVPVYVLAERAADLVRESWEEVREVVVC